MQLISVDSLPTAMSSTNGSMVYALPTELWWYVFRIATIPSQHNQALSSIVHSPFVIFTRPMLGDDPLIEDKRAMATKCSLMLVCKHWRDIALGLFYESVQINDHWNNLLDALEHSQSQENTGPIYGPLIRKLTFTTYAPALIDSDSVNRLFRLCTHAELLIRLDDDDTPSPSLDGQLDSIKRFDWRYFYHTHTHSRNVFNGGLEFFRAVVSRASNLQYLTIRRRYPMLRMIFADTLHQKYTLENLVVLNVKRLGGFLRDEIEGWAFPKLTHIITDFSLIDGEYSSLFTPQINYVEFVEDERLLSLEGLGFLRQCPNIRELSYYIEYAKFPALLDSVRCNALEVVRVHARNAIFRDRIVNREKIERRWRIYRHHFSKFADSVAFPSLKTIVLHGDEWESVVAHPRFASLVERLVARGCRLVYPDDIGHAIAIF